jgi:hypothetical protein
MEAQTGGQIIIGINMGSAMNTPEPVPAMGNQMLAENSACGES